MKIDINNGYKCTIEKHYHTIMGGMGLNPSYSGKTYDVTGSSNQYFVYATVTGGSYTIKVFDNPFV